MEEEDEVKGLKLAKIVGYFIIYSFIGYIIETIFCLVTEGVIESRKNFLYGPICSIYGVGAVIMVLGLQKFQKNNYTLFAGGFILGSLVEYAVSLGGELIYHIRWWDYSNVPFNINGRICVLYSIIWGFLAIYLMRNVHPRVDALLDRINPYTLRKGAVIVFILLVLNFIITSFALKMFYVRLVNNYKLDIEGVEEYINEYSALYYYPEVKAFIDTYFSDEIMLKAFPNIKVTEKDGDIILVRDILKDIQPYYFRVFTPRNRIENKVN